MFACLLDRTLWWLGEKFPCKSEGTPLTQEIFWSYQKGWVITTLDAENLYISTESNRKMMEISNPPGCDWRFLSVRKTFSCPNAWIHRAWNQHQLHHPNVPCCLMATYPTCLKQGLSEARVKKTNPANKICFQWQYDHLSVLNLKISNIRNKIHDRSSFSQTSDMSFHLMVVQVL